MLIGFMCGALIKSTTDNNLRINKLFIVGTILTFSGFLLDFGMPINKKIWSPTFVLTTCGLAASFPRAPYMDYRHQGLPPLVPFLRDIRRKSLFLYCLGSILSIIIGAVKVPLPPPKAGSPPSRLALPGRDDARERRRRYSRLPSFAISFVLFNWCIGYILYKKHIYIKI